MGLPRLLKFVSGALGHRRIITGLLRQSGLISGFADYSEIIPGVAGKRGFIKTEISGFVSYKFRKQFY